MGYRVEFREGNTYIELTKKDAELLYKILQSSASDPNQKDKKRVERLKKKSRDCLREYKDWRD